jgi:hypothetical protein
MLVNNSTVAIYTLVNGMGVTNLNDAKNALLNGLTTNGVDGASIIGIIVGSQGIASP